MIRLFLIYFHYFRVKTRLNRKASLLRIIRKNRCKSILEIGVYHGETAEGLISEALRNFPHQDVRYVGIDLFKNLLTPAIAKTEASNTPLKKIDIENKLVSQFPNVSITLLEGFSKDVLPQLIGYFDFIFIDGGHSYETVREDVRMCKSLLSKNGVIVLDDYTNDKAEIWANYGIKKLVKELDLNFWHISLDRFPDYFHKDWGILITRLVTLRRRV
jgi:predicted O-methyltransferase YrrM